MAMEEELVLRWSDPDYLPLTHLQTQCNQVKVVVDKCTKDLIGGSLILIGQRSFGPISIIRDCVQGSEERVVWLNGALLSDMQSILKHTSWQFAALTSTSIQLNTFEQLGEFLETHTPNSLGPIIFVLEELDKFVEEQSLLYTLFEAAISKLPVLVIGVASRYDVVSVFEKRVKSRFSHHCIAIGPPTDFGLWLQVLQEALSCSNQDAYNQTVKTCLKNAKLLKNLEAHFQIDYALHPLLLRLLGSLPDIAKTRRLKPDMLLAVLSQVQEDELVRNLEDLPLPTLIVLVCLARLSRKFTITMATAGASFQPRFTFEAVWQEYAELKLLASQIPDAQMSLAPSRDLFRLAWSTLQELGFIRRTTSASDSWDDEAIQNVTIEVALNDLPAYLKACDACPEYLAQLAIVE